MTLLFSLSVLLWLTCQVLAKDRYDAFLDEVHWIASRAELESFKALQTDDDKDAFIARFWRRRDPTPDSERNEFKEEHYRRWEYVNQAFREGVAGWRTDRGRIYLIHGQPDDQAFKSVPIEGRAGTRRSRDSIVWTYFQLPNSEYYKGRIVLVFQANIGLTEQDITLGESRTALSKAEQQYRRSGMRPADLIDTAIRFRLVAAGPPTALAGRGEDIPASGLGEYARYVEDVFRSPGETLERAEARREATQRELRQQIETQVSFGSLPLRMVSQPFYSDDYATVAVSWQLPIPEISFENHDGTRVGRIDLLAQVVDAQGKVVDEFFKDFQLVYTDSEYQEALKSSFRHLNEFHLMPGEYKISTVVKDPGSNKIGAAEQKVVCHNLSDRKLALSGLVAASRVVRPEAGWGGDDLVVEGWQVVPEADLNFASEDHLVLYVKVYNGRPSKAGPRIVVSANFMRDGKPVRQLPEKLLTRFDDPKSGSAVYCSVVDLADFETGNYVLQVSAVDLLGKQFAYERLSLDISKR